MAADPSKVRRQRLAIFGIAGVIAVFAFWMIFQAFSENLVFFYSPSDVAEGKAPVGKLFRIGGMVENGSVVRDGSGSKVQFRITDTAHSVTAVYTGILPDLFKEGQGVVAQGKLNEKGVLEAREVLAKHDENYMPPEAKEAIDKAHQKGVKQQQNKDKK